MCTYFNVLCADASSPVLVCRVICSWRCGSEPWIRTHSTPPTLCPQRLMHRSRWKRCLTRSPMRRWVLYIILYLLPYLAVCLWKFSLLDFILCYNCPVLGLLVCAFVLQGASILLMLNASLPGEQFRKGIIKYLHQFSGLNTETGDLWNSLTQVDHVNCILSDFG